MTTFKAKIQHPTHRKKLRLTIHDNDLIEFHVPYARHKPVTVGFNRIFDLIMEQQRKENL